MFDDGGLSSPSRAAVITEDGQQVARHASSSITGQYDDHVAFDPERARRDWLEMQGLIETSLGLRHHLSQVARLAIPHTSSCLMTALERTPVDRNRWLYTAITRAEGNW